MNQENKTIENLRRCPRFNWCSISVCPLDLEAKIRIRYPDEKRCPFAINKKSKLQKGIRTQMTDPLLKFVHKSNLEMLNKRNLKRWHSL